MDCIQVNRCLISSMTERLRRSVSPILRLTANSSIGRSQVRRLFLGSFPLFQFYEIEGFGNDYENVNSCGALSEYLGLYLGSA